MIRKKVYSPILFFVLMLFIGCNNHQIGDANSYELYKNKGDTLLKKVQLDSAYFYYNLATESCNDSKDENHTYALLQMATIQQHISDYYGSEETVTEALDHSKDTIYKPYLYNMLAVTYDKQRKYDDALLYYTKAFQTFKDSMAKAIALHNIGLIYREKGQLNKAVQIFKPLLKNRHLKANRFEIARVLDNLGYAQFKINDPAAYSNLSESLRLRDSLKDIIGSIPSYIHLSEFFLATDKAKAKMLAEKALALANTIKSPDDRLESLRWLAKSTDPSTAQKYASDYITLNDSLSFARSSAKNQYFKIKHDFAKSKKAKEEAEFMTKKITVALIVITLLLLIMIFLVRYVNRQKLRASVYNTETRISKKSMTNWRMMFIRP
ncbi:MAG: tetratricopeptide repeat protein [Flavobacterium sp. JAD_PAG50586_2]|nr:MAG: tetratricopeptide repeat protein [Flavobacterium sp. JAD_PAG50586_2]